MAGEFFVNKTSLEMFDTFRAYGLALAIKGLSRLGDVEIEDCGPTFVIKFKGEVPQSPDSAIFADCEGWQRIFRTFRERKDAKKKNPKDEVKEILEKYFKEILEMHRNPEFMPEIDERVENGMTLYQSIDVSAAKGFREKKLGKTYHEGTQLKVDKYSWAIACLGAAHFGCWQEGADFITSLVPHPFKVLVLSHRQIYSDLLQEKLCRISSSVTLAHYAVKLMRLLEERRISEEVVYDSIVFNIMRKTGQQPKPAGGGRYELEFLKSIASEEKGRDALNTMDEVFNMGFVKGIKQDMASALADFILHPTLENLQRYEDLHLRAHLKREKVPYWNERSWTEVMKHVQTV
ncbi:MAG: hypothetical protein QXX33_04070 [Candidatus Hadarchaeales archaeon]